MSNNGKQGEQLFQQIMEQRGYTVKDVSNNEEYWDKDIDFLVTSSTTGLTKSFEVKWDTRINKTGNLYLELISAYGESGLGWFKFCQADFLAYGDATNGTFYIIPLLELKERVNQMPKRLAQCGTDSVGQLVSLQSIKDITQIL